VTATLDGAALLVTAGALLAAAIVLVRTADVPTSLGVLLDLLTAAGLLRLATEPTPTRLASAAGIIALRKLATFGFNAAGRPRTRRG